MSEGHFSQNLRRIRTARQKTQAELAEAAGISRVAYRKIESGESTPKVSTLQNIARSLDVSLQDLVTPAGTLRHVRFRAQKRMVSRDQVLADVARWLVDFNFLEETLCDRAPYHLSDLAARLRTQPPSPERAVRAAAEARSEMGLNEKEPIRDICGLLEFFGIKVYPMKLASEGFFGLSVAAEDGGPAIIVNVWDRISVERWIFSAAHELGHLLLHLDAYDVSESGEDKSQEDEANIFASHFLMPEKEFAAKWEETYGLPLVERVLKIKRIFKVSYRTVLCRLDVTTGRGRPLWQQFYVEYQKRYGRSLRGADEPLGLSPDTFQESYAGMLRSGEPDNLSDKDFVEGRLSRLVRRAIERQDISVSRGAEVLRLDLEAMREMMASWVA